MRGKNLINQVSHVVNEWLENCVKIAKLLYTGSQTLHWRVSSEISFRSKLEFCRILTKPLSAFGPGLCKELSPVPYFQYWCISLPFLEPFSFSIQGSLNEYTIKDCKRHNRPKLHSNLNLNPDHLKCHNHVVTLYSKHVVTEPRMKWDEKILD